MARQVSPYHMRQARDFIKKFGISRISIDEFDMFIIDNGMAKDPKTDDKSSLEFQGFVGQRATARKRLNNAGSYLNGDAFQIRVPKSGDDKGINYYIEEWNDNRRGYIKDIGNRVETYTSGRYGELERLANQIKELCDSDPDNVELAETNLMINYMKNQGIALQAKVIGLVTQYNVAANGMEDHIQKLLTAAKKS